MVSEFLAASMRFNFSPNLDNRLCINYFAIEQTVEIRRQNEASFYHAAHGKLGAMG
jgi:hypothetical protein